MEAVEEELKFRIEPKDLDVRLCQHGLIRVQRREGLQLDQLRLQFAGRVTHESEVDLNEHRVRNFVWHAELRRDRRLRSTQVLGIVDKLVDKRSAVNGHPLNERRREETRGLAECERNVHSATRGHLTT